MHHDAVPSGLQGYRVACCLGFGLGLGVDIRLTRRITASLLLDLLGTLATPAFVPRFGIVLWARQKKLSSSTMRLNQELREHCSRQQHQLTAVPERLVAEQVDWLDQGALAIVMHTRAQEWLEQLQENVTRALACGAFVQWLGRETPSVVAAAAEQARCAAQIARAHA
ncbi:uncharacterized protein MONBRDRAFT_29673 [Monosiga brevicollis MX1]|uniref:Uncharacterized protein n=1 Tax=Monosiga brevicollis TaxID=81824 RepID=A9VBT2_MONBE|nr:uncharacterized protein MONBRDRAFT_29673 [Monosiga brevicollis MX1]EDQ85032.1 predicted protein [Monosiga brevicollis MX1]|eukprot:XP_001750202.1 hypothetical protein [Monosiga brevicollis MX1]